MMNTKSEVLNRLVAVIMPLLILTFSIQLPAQAQPEATRNGKGLFYLVGMGPGDPDLVTIRAMRIVQKADLVICLQSLKERFAHLITKKEVMVVPETLCTWRGYGKDEKDNQDHEIDRLLESEKARAKLISRVRETIQRGKTVVVLDDGDPLIYGKWIWCLEECEDLDPIVIPGLSSYNAANAAIKKDVTVSDTVKSVILTTDDWPGKRDTIEKLSSNQATMVIFTMRPELKELISKLSTHYPLHTPIAIVCHAGHKHKEYVIKGTLENILKKTKNKDLPFGHLVYVGKNVDFRWKK